LLGKSAAGERELHALFDANGQALRHNTKLQDAKYYDAPLTSEGFTNLYPFLPAHFDILLHLLGALAKSTGGVGLRSAIKVIQDVLRGEGGTEAMALQPVGWLATTATLYDELEKDIRRAFLSVHQAVGKALIRFPDSKVHQDVAKSIAVLQILGNLPVSVENVASLIHPSVTAPSQRDTVHDAVEEMVTDPLVPLGEKNGTLVFLSDRLRDIEQERAAIAIRTVEVRRNFNDALRDAFDPLPRVSINGTLPVTTGLKVQTGSVTTSIAGDQNAIQTVVEFVDPTDHDTARNRMLEDSRSKSGKNAISLLARSSPDLDDLAVEIFRCKRIVELHRNEPDQEIRDYCTGQLERATKVTNDLQVKIKQALQAGSFVFRGEVTAVSALDSNPVEATKKLLAQVGGRVFDRYSEAPVRVPTDTAEKLLKVANPAAITNVLDPLGFVQAVGGNPVFGTDHKAMISVRDYIDRLGTVEGRRLLDEFADDPFGWSPDTTRYIIAAMLMAGEIKLKVSGRQVTAAGQQAIEALKNNTTFKQVGVSLREGRPPIEMLAKASERLSELVGELILPLEQEITKATAKYFPRFQAEYGVLSEKLSTLGLSGSERVQAMNAQLADVLSTDASDAPALLGSDTSVLYENLKWANGVKRALDGGLEATLRDLRSHQRDIDALPKSGTPGDLRRNTGDDLTAFSDRASKQDFYKYAADFNSLLTQIKGQVRDTVTTLSEHQQVRLTEGVEDLKRMPEWEELTQEERSTAVSQLEELVITPSKDINGLKALLTRDYELGTVLDALKRSIKRDGQARRFQRHTEGTGGSAKLVKDFAVPAKLKSRDALDNLIKRLYDLGAEAGSHAEFEINISVEVEK
jgi:hypothetical protein